MRSSDAQQMRMFTAYEFERLADRNNFIVVYPEGGFVRSAVETVHYFSRLAGYTKAPEVYRYPHLNEDETWVERMTWNAPSLPEITLYTVYGGGHTILQPRFEFPRFLGLTNADISTPEEIWKFFEPQMQIKTVA